MRRFSKLLIATLLLGFIDNSITNLSPFVNPKALDKPRPRWYNKEKNERKEKTMTEPTEQKILDAAEELLRKYRLAFEELAK